MAAPEEASARVHDEVTAEVTAPVRREPPPLAGSAQSEGLILDDLGDRETIVDLREVEVAHPDAGPAQRFARRSREAAPSVIEEQSPRRNGGAMTGRRRSLSRENFFSWK